MRVAHRVRGAAAAALCVALAAVVGVYPGLGVAVRAQRGAERFAPQPATAPATSPAAGFLAEYVRPDGRVARPDQGDDTVSEGQAYGLLVAETTRDDARFRRIWRWTKVHLQRPDGLFAYHAGPGGQVWDPEPASDADLLIAWALVRYAGPEQAAMHRSGRRVADAVLASEVSDAGGGMPVLTAGPWATGQPATVDPSYWSLPAFTGLARLTGDARWQRMADDAVALTRRLTTGGRRLPPDWAEVTADGEIFPEAAPNGSQSGARYGLDAQRTVIWFATSCDPRARALAANWWHVLGAPGRGEALALNLDGTVLDPTRAVLPLVARAAAASAHHDDAAAVRLLSVADDQQRRHPGYYGAAWDALGPLLLENCVASGC